MRPNTASSPVYVIYWEKLEFSGLDGVGEAIVIFYGETEKKHKFPRYLYFVSMSRIDPVTQNIRLLLCTNVAPLAEFIRNHVLEETVQMLVQHAHAKEMCY